MKRLLRIAVLLLALVVARTTDGILVYTWHWVPTPGVGVGGFWTLVAVEPL